MEDDVDVWKQRVEHARNGQVELVEVLLQVDDRRPRRRRDCRVLPTPEVVDDGHVRVERSQPSHEVRADHAGAARHEDARAVQVTPHKLIMGAGSAHTRLDRTG